MSEIVFVSGMRVIVSVCVAAAAAAALLAAAALAAAAAAAELGVAALPMAGAKGVAVAGIGLLCVFIGSCVYMGFAMSWCVLVGAGV